MDSVPALQRKNPQPPKRAPKRRRVECRFIEKEGAREVTFSKRHQGLFRKADEISLLCGAEVAVITYSPHGNPFAFAHPSTPDAHVDRYLSGTATGPAAVEAAMHRKLYEDSVAKLEESKGEAARIAAEARKRKWWLYEAVVDDMEEDELEYYVTALETLSESSSGSDYYSQLLARDMEISMDMQAALLAEIEQSLLWTTLKFQLAV